VEVRFDISVIKELIIIIRRGLGKSVLSLSVIYFTMSNLNNCSIHVNALKVSYISKKIIASDEFLLLPSL